ncbi:MAG: type II/IV secretion system ATPase subunit [Candidatus Aenigmatarchaeota archaeon]|nr:MAG: type II/IV secretion system ATPase subunit [Candidatus Aenigmarchaeota archaeon]
MVEAPQEIIGRLLEDVHERTTHAGKVFENYTIAVRGVPMEIEISRTEGRATPSYILKYPALTPTGPGTEAEIRSQLIKRFKPTSLKFTTVDEYRNVEERFESTTYDILETMMPNLGAREKKMLAVRLLMEMIGLDKLEPLLHDDSLEEICVNSSGVPAMVYHRKYGWLTTNVVIATEKAIDDLAEKIASRFGKEINIARPLLDDAMLVTGDRVTATLYPISTKGNTLTIRKFRRNPWTIVDFISPDIKTLSPEVAALLWTSVQYELNMLIAGGTASGKTSLLNAVLLFVPPEQRIISIEDARELNLPETLHWIPLTTRASVGEKADQITVLDLMLSAMRMRPDRIVLGEVRTSQEAQTLFEASDTGHSTYSTLHATRIDGIFRRLLNPPINVPKTMMASMHLALVQYRQKRLGFRRTLEVAEITSTGDSFERVDVKANTLFRWNARKDALERVGESARLVEELLFFSGMTRQEMDQDLEEKTRILNWMLAENVRSIEEVSKVINAYYTDKEDLLGAMSRGKPPEGDRGAEGV